MPEAEAKPYRLSLGGGLEPFRGEIEYVCDVLDAWYPMRRDANAKTVLHYGPGGPGEAIRIPARLFPRAVDAGADGLRLDASAYEAIARDLLPPARPEDAGAPTYDAIGLIFLMLTRIEERCPHEPDRYGRFPFEASFAARFGLGNAPLADRAAEHLAAAILGRRPPPRRTSFSVMLTHDVDRLRAYHRWHEPLRHAAGDLIRRGRPARALSRLHDGYASGEPLRSMRDLMGLAERHGLVSRFYAMGPSDNAMDSPYAATMAGTLRQALHEIRDRGHIVGFHPGFGTANDPGRWMAQKSGLEAVLGDRVTEGRQHVLGYDAAATPDIWDDAGMALDATLAYPERTHFRAGTCRAFPSFSLRHRRKLALRQVCTSVMDFALLGHRYRSLTRNQAMDEALRAAEVCRRFDGTLVVLYHTGRPSHPGTAEFFDEFLAAVT